MKSVELSNGEKVEVKPLAWPAYKALRRLVIKRTELLTSEDGAVSVIRKVISQFTRKEIPSEALTDDQAATSVKTSEFGLQLAESLCDAAIGVVKSIGALNDSLDELTELLIISGTTLGEEQAKKKLEAWAITDVLAIRDAIWAETEWEEIRKAELGFFGRVAEKLGLSGKTAA